MTTFKTLVLAAATVALATGAATAAMAAPSTDGAIVISCAPDIKKFCTDKKYAKQKIRVCLEAQKDKLSEPCKAELAKK